MIGDATIDARGGEGKQRADRVDGRSAFGFIDQHAQRTEVRHAGL